MFEITTRPPNSFVFQNNQQQQQQQQQQYHHHQHNIQHQPDIQQHRRNQAIQQFRHYPRSSSLAAPNNNFDSARNFPQFFFHNNLNNLTHQNLNNDIIYKLPNSSTNNNNNNNNGDSINQDRYVTKIITNDKSKNLTSSSLSYFNPNDTLSYSTDLNQIKYSNNGTILPVYYKNESTGQTSAINNTLLTVRNIPVINSISKPSLNTKSNNLLPNLINTNNNNGSAGTAVVTITNNNNNNNNNKNNGVKTFNSFTNLTDNSSDFNRSSAKTTHIPITHSK